MPTDSKYTEIYRKRLSESLKGKRASEETKRIQSEAKMSPNKSKKRVHKYSSKEYQRNKEKYLERQRRYRENPEKRAEYLRKQRERSRRWYLENKEKRIAYNKKWWNKRVASLETEVGRKKPDECEVCKKKGRICFDHDHKTGKFRGWICHRCNSVLGMIEDDQSILKALNNYLDNVT